MVLYLDVMYSMRIVDLQYSFPCSVNYFSYSRLATSVKILISPQRFVGTY